MHRTLTLALLAALTAGQLTAQITRPPFHARATMQAVAKLLEQAHVSRQPLDDTISERAFAILLRGLDPLGLYLLQSDVDALAEHRKELDDVLRSGDDAFALRLQQLYQQRVVEGVGLGHLWIGRQHDFAVDETMALEVGIDGYARDRAELDDRWRRRVKYDLLVLEGDGVKADEAAGRLHKRYQRLGERIAQRQPEDVDAGFLEAVASAFDPHTGYMAPRVAENFAIRLRTNYEGIGATLRDEDGRVVIAQLMPGGAAQQSGQLQVGDVISAVGQGEDGEPKPIVGMELDDVVDLIRGPRDTTVRLSVTTGAQPARVVVLQRKQTELLDSLATGKVMQAGGRKIGWIDLPSFYADPKGAHSASRDVKRILDDFGPQGLDCAVLDLRWNGGGLLPEAVAVAGLFLDTGNVVQVRGPGGRVDRLDDEQPGAAWAGPLLVLTSRISASASEIVAGAIVDHGRGIVVGDTATHGKGTVQRVIDLGRQGSRKGDLPSGALRLTVQQFFRPGGASTQLRGVGSDITLPSWSQAIGEGEAALPHALPFSTIEPAVEAPRRDAGLLAALAKASAQRVQADPEFAKVVADNARLAGWRQRKQVPLQREAFFAFRGERQRELPRTEPDAKADAFYVGEVCRIAGDYAAMLQKPRDG